jgi:hypothetical protein
MIATTHRYDRGVIYANSSWDPFLMKNTITKFAVAVLMISLIAVGVSRANDIVLTRITADQAFDFVVDQVDPITHGPANVVIVDCKTPEEFYWIGSCAKVTEIKTQDGTVLKPDRGKVKLVPGKELLTFEVSGDLRVLSVSKVVEIKTERISINIPYETIPDYSNFNKTFNTEFCSDIQDLAGVYDVIIFICRSGKRSERWLPPTCNLNGAAFYEIDQPDGKSCRGGFQGSSYHNAYNGYRGFPGRTTKFQDHESVSWSDAGLPVHIGRCP